MDGIEGVDGVDGGNGVGDWGRIWEGLEEDVVGWSRMSRRIGEENIG